MTLRNHDREFVGGRVVRFECAVSVFVDEAIGVSELLSWIDDNHVHNICAELDSLLVVQCRVLKRMLIISWRLAMFLRVVV